MEEPGKAVGRGGADDFDLGFDDADGLLGADFVEAFAAGGALDAETAAGGREAAMFEQSVESGGGGADGRLAFRGWGMGRGHRSHFTGRKLGGIAGRGRRRAKTRMLGLYCSGPGFSG